MPRSLLPPRGIFAGTRILFDRDLSAPVKETLLQLMALSWGSDSHTTPLLTYPLLEHLTGKNTRTLRGHLSQLRNYQAVLRLQPAGPGQFFLILAEWLFGSAGSTAPGGPATGAGEVLPVPVNDQNLNKNKEQEESTPGWENLHPPADQSGRTTSAHGGASAGNPPSRAAPAAPAAPRLSAVLQQRLRDAGVFPALLGEVAARAREYGFKEQDLLALLEWCAADQPDRPAGLFIGRLRAGARAPQEFTSPPCPRCGMRGRHTPECPHRYALPED